MLSAYLPSCVCLFLSSSFEWSSCCWDSREEFDGFENNPSTASGFCSWWRLLRLFLLEVCGYSLFSHQFEFVQRWRLLSRWGKKDLQHDGASLNELPALSNVFTVRDVLQIPCRERQVRGLQTFGWWVLFAFFEQGFVVFCEFSSSEAGAKNG